MTFTNTDKTQRKATIDLVQNTSAVLEMLCSFWTLQDLGNYSKTNLPHFQCDRTKFSSWQTILKTQTKITAHHGTFGLSGLETEVFVS